MALGGRPSRELSAPSFGPWGPLDGPLGAQKAGLTPAPLHIAFEVGDPALALGLLGPLFAAF